jgi:hypothetical protein
VEPPQAVLVSQPIVILTESVSNPNANDELFYSIVPEQQEASSVEVERLVDQEVVGEAEPVVVAEESHVVIVDHREGEVEVETVIIERIEAVGPVEEQPIHATEPSQSVILELVHAPEDLDGHAHAHVESVHI